MSKLISRFNMASTVPSGDESTFSVGRKLLQSKYQEVQRDVESVATTLSPWMQLRDGSLSNNKEHKSGRKSSPVWRKLLRMDKSVMAVMVMLLLTATLPFLWHRRITAEKPREDESDRKLLRVVRSLHSIQEAEEKQDNERHIAAASVISTRYPWIIQNNTLPNYFLNSALGGGTQAVVRGGGGGGGGDAYQDSAVVFLHQHRGGGEVLSQCMTEIAQRRMLSKAPPWTSDVRADVEADVKGDQVDKALQQPDARFQMGQYSFGMCSKYGTGSCSYFTMLRDPMEREVSSYHYCRQLGRRASSDEMCRVLDANDVTLRDWILHHGSLIFQQLAFSAPLCKVWESAANYSLDGASVGFSEPAGWPCWFKNRVELHKISQVERKHLLDYMLEHLDKWFSVIGLVEEFDTSIQMFEHVYKMPFSKCSGVRRFAIDDTGIHDNRANRKKRKDGYYDDNDPEYLKYDYFVRNALAADYKIYKKAKQIFNVQRQMVSNRINR